MNEGKKPEELKSPQQGQPKMRQIIIEFDEKSIVFVKTEVSSNWELEGVLKNVLKRITKQD